MGIHRRSSKRTKATRAATTVGALAATAGIALTSPGIANAAAPNHGQVTSDLSHALDNFLSATNQANNGIWNPIAQQTGGLLPVINSDFRKDDLTDLRDIAAITAALRDIFDMDFPWTTTPGLIPNIVLPGGQTIDVQSLLPQSMPGQALVTNAADLIDGLLDLGIGSLIPGLPAVPGLSDVTLGDLIGDAPLPPLGDLIKGLEFTHSQFNSEFAWGPIASGETKIQNNFLQTPAELILDLTSIEALDEPLLNLLPGLLPGLDLGGILGLDLSIKDILETAGFTPDNVNLSDLLGGQELPSATVWVPQGSGNYTFLGASAGWWAAAPTADLAVPAILGATDPFDITISIPITSVGASLPFNLASVGNLSTTVLMPLDNGVYAPLSLNVANVNTAFGFGVTNVNITSNNYVGTNGINLNNGQNVLLLQNPFLPIPIVYSLGGINIGPAGAGIYMPSLFGVSLLPNIQLGQKPDVDLGLPVGADDALDALGLGELLNNPLIPTSLINATSFIPGVNGAITQGEGFLTPFYLNTLGAALNPLADWATGAYGPFVDGTGNNILKLSEFYQELIGKLSGAVGSVAPDATDAPATTLAADETSRPAGNHALDPSNPEQIPFSDIQAKLAQDDEPADVGAPGSTVVDDTQTPAPEIDPPVSEPETVVDPPVSQDPVSEPSVDDATPPADEPVVDEPATDVVPVDTTE